MTDRSTVGSLQSKAVLYTGRGDGNVATVGEREVRAPQTGEVRLRVFAAAASPTDILLRQPGFTDLPLPLTPGMDAAGVVEAVGANVTRLDIGDEVMAAVSPTRPEGGAQAGYIVVPAASVVRKPANVSPSEAATLPMNGLTAIYALDIANLRRGDALAVTGGAGWLAYLTITFAKSAGLNVIADAKASDLDLVRSYGADIVVERGAAFARRLREMVPEGVDALLDTAVLGQASFGAIKDGGLYIPVRGWDGSHGERGIQIKPVMVPEVLERTDWLEALRISAEAGEIVPKVSAEYRPEQVVEAQRSLLAGGVRGRPVLVFD